MKQTLLFAALGLASLGAAAQEVGNVISSVPVVQQVQVPRQVCNQSAPVMAPQTSGGGGLLGAIVGAGIGSTIGHGGGTAAAMVAGTALGAIVGNNVEANNLQAQAAAQSMPQCVTEMTLENRIVGYNVTYDYAGRQSTVQMPYDPGPTVRLQVSPVAQSAPSGNVVVAPPVQGVAQSGAANACLIRSEGLPAPWSSRAPWSSPARSSCRRRHRSCTRPTRPPIPPPIRPTLPTATATRTTARTFRWACRLASCSAATAAIATAERSTASFQGRRKAPFFMPAGALRPLA